MAEYNEENPRRTLYNNLKADGYDIESFSHFTGSIDTKDGRRTLYDNLKADGYELGSYEEFSKRLTDSGRKVGMNTQHKSAGNKSNAVQGVADAVVNASQSAQNDQRRNTENGGAENGGAYTPMFDMQAEANRPGTQAEAQYMPAWARKQTPEAEKERKERMKGYANGAVNYASPMGEQMQMAEDVRAEQNLRKSDVDAFYDSEIKADFDDYYRQKEIEAHSKMMDELSKTQPMPASPFIGGYNVAEFGNMVSANAEYDRAMDPQAVIENVMGNATKKDSFGNLVMKRIGLSDDEDAQRKSAENGGGERALTYDEKVQIENYYQKEAGEIAKELQQRMMDEYSKKMAPKNVLEYIGGTAFHESLVGTVIDALISKANGSSGLRRQLRQKAYADYGEKQANMVERVIANTMPLIVDAPVFGGIGKGAGAVAQGALNKAVGKSAARALLTNSFKTKLGMGMLRTGMTFGTYDMSKEAAAQAMNPDGYDASAVMERGLSGFITGAAMGTSGAVTAELTKGLSGWRGGLGKALGFGAEVSVLTGVSGIESAIKNGVDIVDIDWSKAGEEWLNSAGTILILKGVGAVEDKVRRAATPGMDAPKYKYDMELKDAHKKYLEKVYGLKFDSERDIIESCKKLEEPAGEEGAPKGEKSIVLRNADGKTEQTLYEKIMNDPNAPINLKRNIAYIETGKIFSPSLMADYKYRQLSNGNYQLATFDNFNRVIDVEEVTKSELVGRLKDIEVERDKAGVEASINLMQTPYAYVKQAARTYSKENGMAFDEVADIVERSAQGEELSDAENAIVNQIMGAAAQFAEAYGKLTIDSVHERIQEQTGVDTKKLLESGRDPRTWTKEERRAMAKMRKELDDAIKWETKKRDFEDATEGAYEEGARTEEDVDIRGLIEDASKKERKVSVAPDSPTPSDGMEGGGIPKDVAAAKDAIDSMLANKAEAADVHSYISGLNVSDTEKQNLAEYYESQKKLEGFWNHVQAEIDNAAQQERTRLKQFEIAELGEGIPLSEPQIVSVMYGGQKMYVMKQSRNGDVVLMDSEGNKVIVGRENRADITDWVSTTVDKEVEKYRSGMQKEVEADINYAMGRHNPNTVKDIAVGLTFADKDGQIYNIMAVDPEAKSAEVDITDSEGVQVIKAVMPYEEIWGVMDEYWNAQEPRNRQSEADGTVAEGTDGTVAGGVSSAIAETVVDDKPVEAVSASDDIKEVENDVSVTYMEDVRLSDEKNEYGKSFVISKDGSTTFGEISEEDGLTPAPIKLNEGENYIGEDGKNHGYGLRHIEVGHGEQIRNAGFASVQDFVEEVARNFDTIREGNKIADKQTYLLEVSDEHNNTLFIELSKDGTYWNVNSAGIFKVRYSKNKKKVNSLPTIGDSANTDTTGVNHGQENGAAATSENSPSTSEKKDKGSTGGSMNIDPEPEGKQNGTVPLQTSISDSKGTEISANDQTISGENAPKEKKKYDTKHEKMLKEMGDEYNTLEEWVLRQMGGGKVKFRWKSRQSGTGGVGAHTTGESNRSEMMQKASMLDATNGTTPEEYAEYIYDNIPENLKEYDVQDVSNMVIDTLNSYNGFNQMVEAAYQIHQDVINREREAEEEHNLQLRDEDSQSRGFADYEDERLSTEARRKSVENAMAKMKTAEAAQYLNELAMRTNNAQIRYERTPSANNRREWYLAYSAYKTGKNLYDSMARMSDEEGWFGDNAQRKSAENGGKRAENGGNGDKKYVFKVDERTGKVRYTTVNADGKTMLSNWAEFQKARKAGVEGVPTKDEISKAKKTWQLEQLKKQYKEIDSAQAAANAHEAIEMQIAEGNLNEDEIRALALKSEDMRQMGELWNEVGNVVSDVQMQMESTPEQKAIDNRKKAQLDIILKSNSKDPNLSDHAWVEDANDILTYAEAVDVDKAATPDYTDTDIDNALESGKVTVYSSYPIADGVFVTPSKMEAQSYAGEGKVYSKVVKLDDVAWIDTLQGQYAKVDKASGNAIGAVAKSAMSDKEKGDYLFKTAPVSKITGKEFMPEEGRLTDVVTKYYAENYGGVVTREDIGEVLLDARSVKDSVAHGLNRNKTAAFKSVPEIIKDGVIIQTKGNWKERGYNSVTIAAPIEIGGERYIGMAIVKQQPTKNRFYLHGVVVQKSLQDESLRTGTEADSHQGDIAKILNNLYLASTNEDNIALRAENNTEKGKNGVKNNKPASKQDAEKKAITSEATARAVEMAIAANGGKVHRLDEKSEKEEFAKITEEVNLAKRKGKALEERVSGDRLLDAQDFIEEIKKVGAEVDKNGYVTLYHRGTAEEIAAIKNSGIMKAKEDGLFFSTSENGANNSGYGDDVLVLKVPAEELTIDDIFNDEASVRLPLKGKKWEKDVSEWIVNNNTQLMIGGESYDAPSAQVFYSNAERGVEAIKQEKASGEQWLNMLKKNGGLKAEEDKWIGLSDFLGGKKSVTKQEVLEYIAENKLQVADVRYANDVVLHDVLDEYNKRFAKYVDEAAEELGGNSVPADWYKRAYERMEDEEGDDFRNAMMYDENTGRLEPVRDIYGNLTGEAEYYLTSGEEQSIDATRLEYTTEGLNNKREIALVVPTIDPYKENDTVHFGDAGEGRAVAWVRFGDATDTDGNKVLVIDEIQSKRHQDGREKGYKSKEFSAYKKQMREKYGNNYLIKMTNDEAERYVALSGKISGVPDAPFQKNWHELAMKRMLRYAAENGYDKVAWTTGMQQAARYAIGGVIGQIEIATGWRDGRKRVALMRKDGIVLDVLKVGDDGSVESNKAEFDNKMLDEIVGKELTDKIMNAQLDEDGRAILTGTDLEVGGEGMKGFYDQMLPRFMNKYGKKWGVKVGEVELDLPNETDRMMWSADVTDAMRESVMEGQPMFMKTSKGAVYGWQKGNDVYLTRDGINPDTPAHEYTHLWAKAVMDRAPELWANIKDLLKGTPMWERVMADKNYSNIHGNEDKVASEVLSRLSGKKNQERIEAEFDKMREEAGEDIVESAKVENLINRMKKALSQFWEWVGKNLFGIKKFKDVDEVTDRVLYDLYNKTDLKTGDKAQQAQRRNAENGGGESKKEREASAASEKELKNKYKEQKTEELIVSLVDKNGKVDYEKAREIGRRVASGETRVRTEDRRILQTTSGIASQAIQSIFRGIAKASKGSLGEVGIYDSALQGSEGEVSETERAAKRLGVWYDEKEVSERLTDGTGAFKKGSEASVYYGADGKSVIKVANVGRHGNMPQYLRDIDAFNSVFGEAAYEVIGFTKIKDNQAKRYVVAPIIKQKYFDNPTLWNYSADEGKERHWDEDEISDMMEQLGFEPSEGYGSFENELYIVEDVHSANVMRLSDGRMVVIDADVRAKDDGMLGGYIYEDVASGEDGIQFSQARDIDTPQFKNWFGDWENDPKNASKVVERDKDTGEMVPKAVYHGTTNGKFSIFDKERVGEKWDADERGFFFTDSEAIGKEYTTPVPWSREPGNPYLFKVYLNIKKPLTIDARWFRKAYGERISEYDAIEIWDVHHEDILKEFDKGDYDGVIIDPSGNGASEPKMYVTFEPNQVKSAEENNGDYSPENDDINFMIELSDEGNRELWEKAKYNDADKIILVKQMGGAVTYGKDARMLAKELGREIDNGSLDLNGKELMDAEEKYGDSIKTVEYGDEGTEYGEGVEAYDVDVTNRNAKEMINNHPEAIRLRKEAFDAFIAHKIDGQEESLQELKDAVQDYAEYLQRFADGEVERNVTASARKKFAEEVAKCEAYIDELDMGVVKNPQDKIGLAQKKTSAATSKGKKEKKAKVGAAVESTKGKKLISADEVRDVTPETAEAYVGHEVDFSGDATTKSYSNYSEKYGNYTVHKLPKEFDWLDRNTIEVTGNYYEGNRREIAHGIKNGDITAIREAAIRMAKSYLDAGAEGENIVLVPIPGHNGNAVETLQLANEIGGILGYAVADVIKGKARASQYESKKNGITLTPEDMQFEVPELAEFKEKYGDYGVILVDNVVASGNTAHAALDAIGTDATIMAFAEDFKGETFKIGNNSVTLSLEDSERAKEMSRTLPKMDVHRGWEDGALKKVVVHTSAPSLKSKYPEIYRMAKKEGSSIDAYNLCKDIVKEQEMARMKLNFPNAKVVFPHVEADAGQNKLASVYAEELRRYGFDIDDNVVMKERVNHTGASSLQRLMNRARFEGEIEKYGQYIIVDDFITSGAQVRDLKDYIESNEGQVVLVSSLATGRYGTFLQPREEDINKLKELGVNDEQLQVLGIANSTEDLTAGEVRRLISIASRGTKQSGRGADEEVRRNLHNNVHAASSGDEALDTQLSKEGYQDGSDRRRGEEGGSEGLQVGEDRYVGDLFSQPAESARPQQKARGLAERLGVGTYEDEARGSAADILARMDADIDAETDILNLADKINSRRKAETLMSQEDIYSPARRRAQRKSIENGGRGEARKAEDANNRTAENGGKENDAVKHTEAEGMIVDNPVTLQTVFDEGDVYENDHNIIIIRKDLDNYVAYYEKKRGGRRRHIPYGEPRANFVRYLNENGFKKVDDSRAKSNEETQRKSADNGGVSAEKNKEKKAKVVELKPKNQPDDAQRRNAENDSRSTESGNKREVDGGKSTSNINADSAAYETQLLRGYLRKYGLDRFADKKSFDALGYEDWREIQEAGFAHWDIHGEESNRERKEFLTLLHNAWTREIRKRDKELEKLSWDITLPNPDQGINPDWSEEYVKMLVENQKNADRATKLRMKMADLRRLAYGIQSRVSEEAMEKVDDPLDYATFANKRNWGIDEVYRFEQLVSNPANATYAVNSLEEIELLKKQITDALYNQARNDFKNPKVLGFYDKREKIVFVFPQKLRDRGKVACAIAHENGHFAIDMLNIPYKDLEYMLDYMARNHFNIYDEIDRGGYGWWERGEEAAVRLLEKLVEDYGIQTLMTCKFECKDEIVNNVINSIIDYWKNGNAKSYSLGRRGTANDSRESSTIGRMEGMESRESGVLQHGVPRHRGLEKQEEDNRGDERERSGLGRLGRENEGEGVFRRRLEDVLGEGSEDDPSDPRPVYPELEEGEEIYSESYVVRMNKYHEDLRAWKERNRAREERTVAEALLSGDASGVTTPTGVEATDVEAADEAELFDGRMNDAKIDVSKKGMKRMIKDEILERRRTIETSNLEDALTVHDIKKVTTAEQRKQIPFLLEDPEEAALQTPEMKEVLQKIRDWFDDVHRVLTEEGLFTRSEQESYIENYVTHIWDFERSDPKTVADMRNWIRMNTPYVKERIISTLKEGLDKGLKMKYDDITDIMLEYGHYATEAIANRRLVNFLKGFKMDGMPILVSDDEKDADYVRIDNNALDGLKVYKGAKPMLDVVFGKLHTSDNVPLQNIAHVYDVLGGVMKKINLSLSFFHHAALTETAVSMMGVPKFSKALFKNMIWDAATKGELPAFLDREATKDAVKHFVSLGATQDYAAKEVQAVTANIRQILNDKNIPVLKELSAIPDWLNKGMDLVLWDWLHDGYKVYAYKKIADEIRRMAQKQEWEDSKTEMALDEAGQLVNDTFGGQHWDLLGWSPNTVKWARRALLSPDWTISTIRQALAPFGIGQLYNDDRFWKKWFKNDNVANVRKKYGRAFWLYAFLAFIPFYNMLNAYFRRKDEEDELAKAEEMRKENPDYKSPYELAYPNGMKWWDYTMLGNTMGQQTHLFTGRYSNGDEMYLRWGKQFRELPELFFGRDGFSIPGPMIDKMAGKLNPLLNTSVNIVSGFSLTGWENPYMKNRRGWEKEWGRVQTLIASFMPYSIPTDAEKEFVLSDLLMPSTKGFSNYKARRGFETAIKSGDVDLVGKVYEACVKNGLDADKILDATINMIKATARQEMIDGIEDVSGACKMFDEIEDPTKRKQLKNYIEKMMSAQDWHQIEKDEVVRKAEEIINGENVDASNVKMYDKLQTSDDVIGDWKLKKALSGLKQWKDEYNRIKFEESGKAAEAYKKEHKKIFDKIKDIEDARRKINKEKNKLQDSSKLKNQTQDDLENLDINNEKTMIYIRQIRNRVLDEE